MNEKQVEKMVEIKKQYMGGGIDEIDVVYEIKCIGLSTKDAVYIAGKLEEEKYNDN